MNFGHQHNVITLTSVKKKFLVCVRVFFCKKKLKVSNVTLSVICARVSKNCRFYSKISFNNGISDNPILKFRDVTSKLG